MSVIQSAILKHLQADVAITGLVGTRTYPGFAPEGAALPFITVNALGPVNADLTYGATVSALTGRYSVKATIENTSPTTASTINAALRTSLHNAALTITGMSTQACILTGLIEAYPEHSPGHTYWHEGSIFEVMAT